MSVRIDPINVIEVELGINEYGSAHNKFASLCMEKMNDAYVPKDSGALISSSYVDGECNIHYNTPYAHYMYMGEVYGQNIPFFDENGNIIMWRSKKGVTKTPTGRDITYHPEGTTRGSHWDVKMVNVEKDDIVKRMEEFVKARGRK